MDKNNKILPPIIACILSIVIGQVVLWIINRTELEIISNMLNEAMCQQSCLICNI